VFDESTLEAKVVMAGAVLCLLGLIVLAYGISTMNYADAVSSSLAIILGIFIGIAGLFMLMMNLLPSRAR
jgi:uncharacterized membrane protein